MRNHNTLWMAAFCASATSCVLWPKLPSASELAIALILACCLSVLLAKTQRRSKQGIEHKPLHRAFYMLLHGVLTGTIWMASVGHWHQSWQLPESKIQQDVTITGRVVERQCEPSSGKEVIAVSRLDELTLWPARKMRIQHASGLCLQPDQIVQLTVKLKPAWGLANPGSMRFSRWLAAKGIVATGYANPKSIQLLTPANTLSVRLFYKLADLPLTQQRWIQVLVMGDRGMLQSDDWRLLKHTGLSHLFSISGLHVGIIALWMSYGLALVITAVSKALFRRAPHWNMHTGIWLGCAGICIAYCVYTGAQLPVIRACVLLCIGAMLTLQRRQWANHQNALCMIMACIVIDPLSVLSASFYLSISAVCAIWFVLWRWPVATHVRFRRLKQAIQLQCAVSLLTLPVVVMWFHQIPWLGLLFNLIVVPVVTLLTPLCVIAGLLLISVPIAGQQLFLAIDALLSHLFIMLRYLDAHLPLSFPVQITDASVLLLLGILLFMLLPGMRYRYCCSILACLSVAMNWVQPPFSRWQVHVFDVGQGTSILISRGSHGMLIDTGSATPGYGSMAERVVIPALEYLHISNIDLLVISHPDNDHSGGKNVLLDYLKQRQLQAPWLITTESGCKQGNSIFWYNLQIDMLWPKDNLKGTRNDNSCVLRVSDGMHAVLMPGDIERTAEYALLMDNPELKSAVLVAPHHGSDTSSTQSFIEAVQPDYVVFTQGYYNRWHFPDDAVVTRYQQAGASVLTSSSDGYIRFDYTAENPPVVSTQRMGASQRWYEQAREPDGY